MSKTILCIGGRCSTWGKSWKKHLYDGGEECLRCGMNRREQWEEDKLSGLVTGDYKPNTVKPKAERSITSQQIMFCALGDYGIEFSAPTLKACERWIKEQGVENDFDSEDYYSIVTHTKAKLAAMPEV